MSRVQEKNRHRAWAKPKCDICGFKINSFKDATFEGFGAVVRHNLCFRTDDGKKKARGSDA